MPLCLIVGSGCGSKCGRDNGVVYFFLKDPRLSLIKENKRNNYPLMKLNRVNMTFQDLVYRFPISLSIVSRIFTAWMIAMDMRLSPLIRW